MTDRAFAVAERVASALDWTFDDDPKHIRPVWRKARETGYPWGQIIAWCSDDPCAGLITPCPGILIDVFTTDHPMAAACLGINLEQSTATATVRGGGSPWDRLSALDPEHRHVFRTADDALDGTITHGLRSNPAALEWLHAAKEEHP